MRPDALASQGRGLRSEQQRGDSRRDSALHSAGVSWRDVVEATRKTQTKRFGKLGVQHYPATSQASRSASDPPVHEVEESPVPHVMLYALEEQLDGRESELIGELTDAVVSVYGAWARASVDIRLIGIPRGRWARGGTSLAAVAPVVQFGTREEVLSREDASTIIAALLTAITDAVAAVFGQGCRDEVLVELIGQPTSRSGIGGEVISERSR